MNTLILAFTEDILLPPKDFSLVTEDTARGRIFYEKLFVRESINKLGGKENVIKFLKSNRDKFIFLCVDWCSFGSYSLELKHELRVGHVYYVFDAYISEETFYQDVLDELTFKTPYNIKHKKA